LLSIWVITVTKNLKIETLIYVYLSNFLQERRKKMIRRENSFGAEGGRNGINTRPKGGEKEKDE
jgi:hypothetical protein